MQVSVVIRVRNEAEHLPSVLAALRAQTVPSELIVVDNGSTDGSREIAAEAGAKLVDIEHFTYGSALNLGIAAASSEAVVLLSAHSVPLGPQFIFHAVAPLDDAWIAAVRCVIGGKPEQAKWTEPTVLRWPVDVTEMVSRGPVASGCVIRRSAWESAQFDPQAIASEDKVWALRVCEMGYGIYSAAPAFYGYLNRNLPPEKALREAAAIYQATGVRIGVLRRSPDQVMRSLVRTALLSAPHTAATLVARELRLAAFCWRRWRCP